MRPAHYRLDAEALVKTLVYQPYAPAVRCLPHDRDSSPHSYYIKGPSARIFLD